MFEEKLRHSSDGPSRRHFLGGTASLIAAAAYARTVPDEVAAQVTQGNDDAVQRVHSPDGSISVTLDVSSGTPTYAVAVDGTTYLEPSTLGFDFQNQSTFGAAADGSSGPELTVTGSERRSATEEWEPVWGAYDSVSAEYNSLVVGLQETDGPGRTANLEIRVFDDGLGFRFVFDESFASNAGKAVVTSENTAFAFADDYTAWWIPNEVTDPRFEQEYDETPLSEIPGGTRETQPTGTPMRNGAHTPLTVEANDGDAYLSVHEADLEDYAAATLAPRSEDDTEFTAELTPLPDGTKASLELPNATPWRTIQVGRRPGDLIESQLIPLLSSDLEESSLPTVDGEPDTDWIEPRKYVGIWWTMIAGSANWEYKSDDEILADGDDPASYIHGARTERMKRYMAFAAANGIDSVLVEGWNQGWDTYPGDGTGLQFGVDDSYPDFDVREVTDFGRSLESDVEMTIHNETAGALPHYEEQILEDDIFQQYEGLGIHSIKNGYVSDEGLGIEGDGAEPTHNQHNQLAVNHHRLVVEAAAANRQLLEIHEGIKPTGEIRTYPNVANREVVKAQEYDGFEQLSSDVAPDHHVTLPFTRNLAGPVSYQPGIFDLTFTDDRGGQVQTTRAKQLAMYPTYLSGLQMAADRIEAYVDETLAVGECLQAASGDIDGFVTLDEWRNAFGTNYVAVDPNRVPSGSSVSFTVEDADAGTYDLHLRYAAAPEDNAQRVVDAGQPQATLRVNDSTRKITPAFTDYWDRWEVFTTEIELEDGDNEVAIELHYDDSGDEFEGDVGGFNLNTIGVSEPGAPSPVPADYEGYTPTNENFDAKPEFEFLESVPAAGWDETRVVDAEIGDYTVLARRKGEEWYVGAMTDAGGRAVDVPLSFLAPGNSEGKGNGNGPRGPKYVAEIYSDGIGADYESDPEPVRIDEAVVDPSTTILASMARSGGTAVRIRPAKGKERNDLPTYERPEQDLRYSIDDEADLGEPFITATGSNDGDFVGGTTVAIEVDGERAAVDNVRLPPGASDETVELGYALSSIGTYDVVLRDPDDGSVLESGTVTVSPGDLVAEFDDPAGDDRGPGEYTYPTSDDFRDGAFDLRSFAVYETDDAYRFAFEVADLYDTFGGEFSPHYFVVYLRDPSQDGGRTTELGDLEITAAFDEPWHYRVAASGFGSSVVDANGTDRGAPETIVDFETDTAILSVPKDALDGGLDTTSAEVLPVVGSEDRDVFRDVAVEAEAYIFGGAREGAAENAPRVIDLLTPDGLDQSEALAYDADELATLPFSPL